MIARIAVSLGLDREFDYLVPDHLADAVQVGSRVVVPFGRRRIDGYVTGFPDCAAVAKLKPVLSVQGKSPFLSAAMLKLVRWMARYYGAPLEHCIRTVLPGAVRKSGDRFSEQLWIRIADGTANRNVPEAGLSEQQQRVLAVLREHRDGLWLTELRRAAKVTDSPAKTLARKGLVAIAARARERDPFTEARVLPTAPLVLTGEQADALHTIVRAIEDQRSVVTLLYGVTGSGKTEIYLQAIQHALENSGTAIVLVPEIALTPQTVARFRARFGKAIAVLHSHLSDGERHDQWHRIATDGARVVIGARSAVFAPLRNLQLIVVDEEHEPSYKQSDAPRYQARDVAVMRGHLEGCAVVLGSATPSLESLHNAQAGKYRRVDLSYRADNRALPLVRVIDMRIEAERHGYPCLFSRDLVDATALRIERGEQVMYFLNRRGYSTALMCTACGYVAGCPACGIPYTYHRIGESLRCHLCGRRQPLPGCCPECGKSSLRYTGFGTQRVEAAARKCFGAARIARLDTDTTHRRHTYEEVLGAFRAGDVDLLIGTQMIAKGLHFPNVTLVGVINADLSLHLADFRAGERTFQLLAQVAGRAGRGAVKGEVLVQTYTPHHPAIQAARNSDFDGFSESELAFRKTLSYPPFTHLICLLCKGAEESRVLQAANTVSATLAERLRSFAIVSNAAPAPMARIDGAYRYHVILRTRSVTRAVAAISDACGQVGEIRGVTIQTDVDAMNLM